MDIKPRHAFTLVVCTAGPIGLFAFFAPITLLVDVKAATAPGVAVAMARTVGVLLVAIAALNFLVRNHPPSPTLRAVVWTNLILQLLILPLDPLAFAEGTYGSLGAFVPNTLLHLGLIALFAHQLLRTRRG